MEQRKIYLAGPMTGIKDFNFPSFMEAAKDLRRNGDIVFNPAEADLEEWGDIEGVRKNYSYRKCLKKDLSWICDNATAIALLPGWENSKGVDAELSLSKALGLEIIYV